MLLPRAFFLLSTATVLGLALSPAEAACTKPAGVYVGMGSGITYNLPAGTVSQATATSLTVNFSNNGQVSATETVKNLTAATSTQSWTVTAAKNVFNSTTCQGTLTTDKGVKFTYTSSVSANIMTMILTPSTASPSLYSIRLEKV